MQTKKEIFFVSQQFWDNFFFVSLLSFHLFLFLFFLREVIDAAVSCTFDFCFYLVVSAFARIILENISAQLSLSSSQRLSVVLSLPKLSLIFCIYIFIPIGIHLAYYSWGRGKTTLGHVPSVHSFVGRQSLLAVFA